MTQPGAPSYTAADIAKQKGHTSLSEELHKGKSKTKIRTQNPFEYISVSFSVNHSTIIILFCPHT